MSEGQPLDVVIASDPPPEELPRSDMLSFENEQERSPEPLQWELLVLRPELSELLQLGREEWERRHPEQQRVQQHWEQRVQQQPELQLSPLELLHPLWRLSHPLQPSQPPLQPSQPLPPSQQPLQLRQQPEQSQPQELYQQPQNQQRYYLYPQGLVTAVQNIGLHRFRLCCSPNYEALSSFKLFLSDTLSRVTGADEITRGFLFLGINGVVIHQLASVNSFTFEKKNLLSFGEAFSMSLPPMVHISMILLSLALNFVLLFRVYPGIQCVLLLLCILMPLYYFAELAHKAAGIAVNLGSDKMPLVWFSTLGGLGIFLIGGSMVLLIVFLSWVYARRRGLEFQGIRVSGDSIIGAMNA
ncbi:uncharacterized protein LOC130973914 [Arachis stenosperma]|uniref:uncharacterized protein LOC130973914 n=1 Tax=Arachis stenosperma TaxID=217475 RepID=UPI0025AB9FF6|nr:uncharacterized protein LOC130973914 [Arachis stenosperma]